jgi:hypothetical protein
VRPRRLLGPAAIAACLAAGPLAAQGAWQPLDADPHAPLDRGTGLLHFRAPPGTRADTLVLREAPRPGAAVVARFVAVPEGPHGWRYELAAREPLVGNVVEVDYEVAGVAFDSVAADGGARWARVIVGARDAAGRDLRRAWAALDSARVATVAWGEHVAALHGVFAVDPARARFAATPGGAPVAPPFRRGLDPADHWMEVQERRGDWLRVRFLQPAAACGDEPPADQVDRTLWIRYLDARGRPLVWYYTRGC